MPSFTFVSTANAFVLRGAIPVFVDIREDTLNLDERRIEAAITSRTRAIAKRHALRIVEDAAQGIMASYKGTPLGAIGDLGSFSFHETKNIMSGEGGALLVNDPAFALRAEIVREKGTDRGRFFRGEVDKYTWQDVGSSLLPSELIAAFLWAQLEDAEHITSERLAIWDRYHALLAPLEQRGLLRRPVVPGHCTHNGHLYYVLLPRGTNRDTVLGKLREAKIGAVFHYVPLHSAPAGMRFGRTHGDLPNTTDLSERLVRLPFWIGLQEAQQERVCETLGAILGR
jgi:dTDP-4-amino-4,6-dideoxygalactose transaminase